MRLSTSAIITASIAAAALAACGGDSAPANTACTGITGTCVAFGPGAKEADISAALVTAKPSTTIAFAAGTYTFTNTLNLSNVSGITIRGAGSDTATVTAQTVLDFSTVTGSGEGILATNTDQILFLNFIARDTKGNGIKVVGSNGVTWRNVKTLWTNADSHTHGAYGLYPVQCHNILIENCEVAGAADAGVYVGQSDHIIVRNNNVHNNVAGIEIENSSYSDVSGNSCHDNVGGILVFNMPDLQINEGGWNHVFNNQIVTNNSVNFAKRGSSVSRVPGGTGAFVLAGHDVEVDHNTFTGNNATAFSIVSYSITGDTRASFDYGYLTKQWPAKIYVHDNTFAGNGTDPRGSTTPLAADCPDPTVKTPAADCPDAVAYGLGQMLYATQVVTSSAVVPLVYDGIVPPSVTTSTNGGTADDLMKICFGATATGFVNLHFDKFAATGFTDPSVFTTDFAKFNCTLPALPAITVTAP